MGRKKAKRIAMVEAKYAKKEGKRAAAQAKVHGNIRDLCVCKLPSHPPIAMSLTSTPDSREMICARRWE